MIKQIFTTISRFNISNILFLSIFTISFVVSFLIFISLIGNIPNLEQVRSVSTLIQVNYFFVIILIIISIRNIVNIFYSQKLKSKFKIKITSLFIFITLIPAFLITVFSFIFFDQGLKIWFNDKIKKVVIGSKEISESYFNEHTSNIKNDILFIKNEISSEKIVFFTDKERLTEYINYFVEIKGLDEAIIFESSGQLLAKVGTFLIESESAPPLWSFIIADEGNIAVFPNEENTKVRALIKLQRVIPTYLYIGKNVDSNVLSRVESVNLTAKEYFSLNQRLDDFQKQFNELFLAINFLMILLSIWFGLRFSGKLIEPIMEIISDSEKIIQNDFSARIRIFEEKNEFNILSKVLNKMLDTLNHQKNKLFEANEIINLRRKFTEKIINEVSTGIIHLDINNKITIWNKKSREIFNYDNKKTFFIKNKDIKNIVENFYKDEKFNKEVQLKTIIKNQLKIINIKISKLKEKKKTKGLILSIDDVTELVEAQKHAAWSNVARYIAHEIKNPLTPIKLSAQRLEKYITNEKNQSLKDCTETIKRQVNNIQSLVTEFSNFARMPESKFSNHKLNEIIESQINSLKILDENITIDYKNEIKDIKLKCDYNQLSRVFLNILKNSYESQTKSAKFISVKVSDGKGFIDIYIEDNGDGFPENRDKLFEPYITNKIDGTGLGLAICKKIIEDHGGEIYLLNSNDFGGASVRIKLYKV